jgi:hypothetical protein
MSSRSNRRKRSNSNKPSSSSARRLIQISIRPPELLLSLRGRSGLIATAKGILGLAYSTRSVPLAALCILPYWILHYKDCDLAVYATAALAGGLALIEALSESSVKLVKYQILIMLLALLATAPEIRSSSLPYYQESLEIAAFCRGAATIFIARAIYQLFWLRDKPSLNTSRR